jgi:pyruvate/2-oxoacid:ferredoxin oxidoreductase beta subunit
MIPQFENLNQQEQELLVKAPVLISVLASCSDHTINKMQKADAIKLAHIKTFTAIPELQPYFKEAEKNFKENFEEIAKQFYPFDEKHRNLLKMEIKKVQEIIGKLNPIFARYLTRSLERYAGHVKRATHTVFRDFIFPLAMFDLKDNQSPVF